jgi:hypothetical protein
MLAQRIAVYKTFGIMVCRANDYKNAPAAPGGWNRNGFPVITGIFTFLHLNAGKFRTPAERNGNFLII